MPHGRVGGVSGNWDAASPHSLLSSFVLLSPVGIWSVQLLAGFHVNARRISNWFSAAAGIALVVSVSNFGGFVGPYTVGLIRQRTGGSYYGLIYAGVSFLVSAALAMVEVEQLVIVLAQRQHLVERKSKYSSLL